MAGVVDGPSSMDFAPSFSGVLEDEIALDKMTDPFIDPCGHTLDRSTWEKIHQKALNNDKPFLCPFTQKPISMDKLYPNRAVLSASAAVSELEKGRPDKQDQILAQLERLTLQNADLKRTNAELKQMQREQMGQTKLLLGRLAQLDAHNQSLQRFSESTGASLKRSAEINEELVRRNADLSGSLGRLFPAIEGLNRELQATQRRLQNALNMPWYAPLYSAAAHVWCDHSVYRRYINEGVAGEQLERPLPLNVALQGVRNALAANVAPLPQALPIPDGVPPAAAHALEPYERKERV